MRASATWIEGFESRLDDGRGHTTVVDLPIDEDGADHGTSALELSVESLAGCIVTIFALVARRRRLAFRAFRVDLDAERPKGAPTITRVVAQVDVTSDAAVEDVETAVAITIRTCPVGVLFDRAGVPVEVTTRVRRSGDTEQPAPPHEDPSEGGGRHGHHGHHQWTRDEAIAVLERPERRQIEDPEQLWKRVGLSPGGTVAEIGAGTGYYAVPAARSVGPTGRVFAIDLSEDLVGYLKERARAERLPQLTAIQSALARIPLPSGASDVVLLANVLHDIPAETLTEAVRLLRPGGRFVNVDWKKEPTEWGPPVEIRLDPDAAARRLVGAGLVMGETFEFGPHHYGQILEKPPSRR